MRLPSGTVDQYLYFYGVDATDFTTPETGKVTGNWTTYAYQNNVALGTAGLVTPTVTEVDATNAPGLYKMLLNFPAAITAGNDSEELVFHTKATGVAPIVRTVEIYRPKISLGETLTVASGLVSNTTVITLPTIPAGWITAAGIATGAIDADAIATDAVTEIQSGLATAANLATVAEYVDTEVAAIKAKTDLIPAAPAAVGNIPTALQNADALLDRDMSQVSDTNARSPLNSLRLLRNKWSVSGATMSVCGEDDSTVKWTSTLSTDPAADPVTASDPS